MSRFIPRHIIGRMVDEVARIHELRAALSRQMDDPVDVRAGLLSAHELLGRGASIAPLSDHPFAQEGSGEPGFPTWGSGGLSPPDSAVQSTLSEVEDRRRFQFSQAVPLRRVTGQPVGLRTARAKPAPLAVPQALAFDAPKAEVITCLRRKARRTAILAFGHGGSAHRRPRRTPDSNIRCE